MGRTEISSHFQPDGDRKDAPGNRKKGNFTNFTSRAALRIPRLDASVLSHFAGPAEKAQNLQPFAPGEAPEFDKADAVHPDPRIGFQTPAQVRAPPRRQMMAASCVPEKSQDVPHSYSRRIMLIIPVQSGTAQTKLPRWITGRRRWTLRTARSSGTFHSSELWRLFSVLGLGNRRDVSIVDRKLVDRLPLRLALIPPCAGPATIALCPPIPVLITGRTSSSCGGSCGSSA